MMIQGWRKYAPVEELRYQPEITFSIDGQIYKFDDYDRKEFDLMHYIHYDPGDMGNPCYVPDSFGRYVLIDSKRLYNYEPMDTTPVMEKNFYAEKMVPIDFESDRDYLRNRHHKHGSSIFKKRTLVEAEIAKGTDAAGIVVEVDSTGRFSYNIPPFYDEAFLFMTAYTEKDSVKKCMASASDKESLNPMACPDFYVRRDLFYPRFCAPYGWQQTHFPEEVMANELAENEKYDTKHVLKNVTVKRRRYRPLSNFDKSKPAFVCDFAQLLNDATDEGIRYGGFNGIVFWEELACHLFGNMDDPLKFVKIRVTVDNHTFLKTYKIPSGEGVGEPLSALRLAQRIDPSHIWQVRVYTDYDKRNGIGRDENQEIPDVLFDVVPIPNEGKRAMRRDRRILIDGFAYPEQFYHRDYSGAALPDSSDYRRTLYWNPNAHPDKDGNLNIQFYNGARPAHLKVSICGVGEDGKIYYY